MNFLEKIPQKRKVLFKELCIERQQIDVDDFENSSTEAQKRVRRTYKLHKHTVHTRERRISMGKTQFNIPKDAIIETRKQFNELKHESPQMQRNFICTDDCKTVLGIVHVKPPPFSPTKKSVNTAQIGLRMQKSTLNELLSLLNYEFSEIKSGRSSVYEFMTDPAYPEITLTHDEWKSLRTRAWKLGKEGRSAETSTPNAPGQAFNLSVLAEFTGGETSERQSEVRLQVSEASELPFSRVVSDSSCTEIDCEIAEECSNASLVAEFGNEVMTQSSSAGQECEDAGQECEKDAGVRAPREILSIPSGSDKEKEVLPHQTVGGIAPPTIISKMINSWTKIFNF
jgi:hypothetical protein